MFIVEYIYINMPVCFFFFFSSRRRHTRLSCDWSSDVCSSDLSDRLVSCQRLWCHRTDEVTGWAGNGDRKSVVEGKRVDLGGRRIIKKKKKGGLCSGRCVGGTREGDREVRDEQARVAYVPPRPPRSLARRRPLPGRTLFFFQAEDGIRDYRVTGVQTCALPIWSSGPEHVALKVLVVELDVDLI